VSRKPFLCGAFALFTPIIRRAGYHQGLVPNVHRIDAWQAQKTTVGTLCSSMIVTSSMSALLAFFFLAASRMPMTSCSVPWLLTYDDEDKCETKGILATTRLIMVHDTNIVLTTSKINVSKQYIEQRKGNARLLITQPEQVPLLLLLLARNCIIIIIIKSRPQLLQKRSLRRRPEECRHHL